MTIQELVSTNVNKGYSLRQSQNIAAEEIILKKIASSSLVEHVTLKGGIVLYNLAKNSRRVTQDIDFDLIKYSIDKESIRLFVNKLNAVDDGFKVALSGDIEDLHQEDYKGVRAKVVITDKENKSLRLKLDIGVHTYSAIEQNSLLFNFSSSHDCVSITVNPPEQIFAEKVISLARLGVISTRYKDIYDIYFLIKDCKISSNNVRDILKMFFKNTHRKPDNFLDLRKVVESTLNDENFIKDASKPIFKWIDDDFDIVKKTIIDFIYEL